MAAECSKKPAPVGIIVLRSPRNADPPEVAMLDD
jgi:hypothetical protein